MTNPVLFCSVQGWASVHTSCVTSVMWVCLLIHRATDKGSDIRWTHVFYIVVCCLRLDCCCFCSDSLVSLNLFFQLAMKTRCTGMMFVVAENNEPSVQFYKRRGAEDLSQEEGWRLFRFDKDSLVKMASKPEEWRGSTRVWRLTGRPFSPLRPRLTRGGLATKRGIWQ